MHINNSQKIGSIQYPRYSVLNFDDDSGEHHEWLIKHTSACANPKLNNMSSNQTLFTHAGKVYSIYGNNITPITTVYTVFNRAYSADDNDLKYVIRSVLNNFLAYPLRWAFDSENKVVLCNRDKFIGKFDINDTVLEEICKLGYMVTDFANKFKIKKESIESYLGGTTVC